MNGNDEACRSGISFKRYGRRLRIVGIVILLLGGVGAGWVYWLGAKSAALMNDPEMLGFNRAKHWQMGVMFGGMGNLMDDLAEDLKQPATQAILIVAVSVVSAAVCFFFARPQEAANSTENDHDSLRG